jgi:hypothetical protein
VGIEGGLIFLSFNIAILSVIWWCITNNDKSGGHAGLGLFAMREPPRKKDRFGNRYSVKLPRQPNQP